MRSLLRSERALLAAFLFSLIAGAAPVGRAQSVITTIPVGTNPFAPAVNTTTNKIYVANAGSSSVSVINGATNTVITTITGVGNQPTDVAVNSVTNKVYVAAQTGVTVIDGATDTVAKTLPLGFTFRLAVNPVTNRVYVSTDGGGSAVIVLDGATDTVITAVPLNSSYQPAVNTVTNKIYVVDAGNFVHVIDGATNTVVKSVFVGLSPQKVAVNSLLNRIYVANYQSSDVTVIDGATDTVVTTVPVSNHPYGIAVDPATSKILVASQNNSATVDSADIISGATNSVIATFAVADQPDGAAINPLTHRGYITHELNGLVTVVAIQNDVLISEFRFHGAAGGADEFIELANTNNTAFTVNSADGSAGWTLVAAGGTVLAQIPNGTIIPPHGHLLVVNSAGYSLAGYPAGNATTATADFSYTQDIPDNSGVALFATQNATNFNAALRLDAVGFTLVSDPLYREGAGIAGFPSSDGEYSLVRKLTTGQPRDTNDNNSDFVFVATQGDTIYGTDSNVSVLGAPGPENLSSPVEHNADVKAALLDSCAGPGPCQNRVRSAAPDPTQSACSPLGTLSIRRRFKNTTQQPITRLRFRVVDITTLGNRAPGEADVRALASTQTAVVLSTGTPATVEGTTLEQPPVQAQCGGLNSSLSAGTITMSQPLAPGASINVQFLLGVVQGGSFRFFINVEALTGASGLTNRTASKSALKGRQ
ncbi:MAG: hypothetical protein ACJ74W_14895 [Pyrinomonadaceae bacterium]